MIPAFPGMTRVTFFLLEIHGHDVGAILDRFGCGWIVFPVIGGSQ